jgi:hypothetical protein
VQKQKIEAATRGVPVRTLQEIHESPANRWDVGSEAKIRKETPGVAGKPAGEWLCAWSSGTSSMYWLLQNAADCAIGGVRFDQSNSAYAPGHDLPLDRAPPWRSAQHSLDWKADSQFPHSY